jgi:hypothetical protein
VDTDARYWSPDLIIEETDVPIDDLRPHAQNYQQHPEDQIEHLKARLRKFGFYRNIVIAQENTILAGHGIWAAAKELGFTRVPARRVDLAPDSVKAMELLAGDNEVAHLAEKDDRALSELLLSIQDSAEGSLEGTGYDEAMLANLMMVTRSSSEIKDFDEAAHWVGLPDYDEANGALHSKVTVSFASAEDREEFCERLGIAAAGGSIWFPPKANDDVISLRFES